MAHEDTPVAGPPPRVLDLFAVPDLAEPVPGGRGTSFRAGDLVLSPGRDPRLLGWLNPVLARLAVSLDETPGRRPGDLRIAVPVPARDGSWVVDGWAASRYEAGSVVCRDLPLTLAAARVLHARLDVAVPHRPGALDVREDRWAGAETLATGGAARLVEALPGALAGRPDPGRAADLLVRVAAQLEPVQERSQLVHGELAGHVLLDAAGAPVVIGVVPLWQPVRWATALCVLDAVLARDAHPAALEDWRTGADRQALLRAVVFRLLGERRTPVERCEQLLDRIG